jgi:Flp pilus assembly pilin Flp
MSVVIDRLGRATGGKPSALRALRRFHTDEQGDEGVNKILIIAMIVVPLVIVLILFGKNIVEFFSAAWKKLTDKSSSEDPEKGFKSNTAPTGPAMD